MNILKLTKNLDSSWREITFKARIYKHLQYFPIRALFSAPNKMVRTSLKQQ